jgi:cytochrome c553
MRAVLKYVGALSLCVALGTGIVFVTDSAAQSAKAGEPQTSSGVNSSKAAPIFGITIPAGYRDWKLISVAHEEGNLNDIRAILGNNVAIKAYRRGTLPFPDGTIIARLAWKYVPSEENNKIFGRAQSFVPGPPADWYLQFMVKDSKKYAATHGWGYAQFDDNGTPADEAKIGTCAPCHEPDKANDFVFTHYAP